MKMDLNLRLPNLSQEFTLVWDFLEFRGFFRLKLASKYALLSKVDSTLPKGGLHEPLVSHKKKPK